MGSSANVTTSGPASADANAMANANAKPGSPAGAANGIGPDLASQTRPDFPLLAQPASLGQPLIYLDHAATSQKPRQVLAALQHYYDHDNANVHRGAHQLSARATEGFEGARAKTAAFVGAVSPHEIVFTRNASEAINLVARSWGDANLKAGDEVLLSVMEHHSNLVPWQLLAARTGCLLRHVGLTDSGELDLADFKAQLNGRTRLVSLVQVSNTLGCLNPIAEIAPWPTPPVPCCWWMPARAWPTCPWMWASSAPISWWAPPTSFAALPAWAFYGHGKPCWRPCPPSWAAAR